MTLPPDWITLQVYSYHGSAGSSMSGETVIYIRVCLFPEHLAIDRHVPETLPYNGESA